MKQPSWKNSHRMVKNQSLVYFRQVIDFILTAFTFSEYVAVINIVLKQEFGL